MRCFYALRYKYYSDAIHPHREIGLVIRWIKDLQIGKQRQHREIQRDVSLWLRLWLVWIFEST